MMQNNYVIVFEDNSYGGFYPITLSRPVFNILVGTKTNLQRIKNFFPEYEILTMCRNYLPENMELEINNIIDQDFSKLILLNGSLLIGNNDIDFIKEIKSIDESVVYVNEDDICVAAVILSSQKYGFFSHINEITFNENFLKNYISKKQKIEISLFSKIWEPMLNNPKIIESDFNEFYKGNSCTDSGDAIVYGKDELFVAENVTTYAGSVIDSRNGPVIIEKGVEVKPFTYIEGPAFIGKNTKLVGGKLTSGCSIGPGCRIGGEVEQTVIVANTNKYHDGFIGHAYIGEWVNIGALTTNSDLSNNYSEIMIKQNGKIAKTKSMKIGSFIGDHTKIGIGMTLNTGAVLGFSCNLFGGSLILEKEIPSFAWGNDQFRAPCMLQDVLNTAQIVMERRNFEFSDLHKKMFKHIYDESTDLRKRWQKRKMFGKM